MTQPSDITNAAGASALRAIAFATFRDAYANAVLSTGEFTDELVDSIDRAQSYADQRNITVANSSNEYPWSQLSAARVDALRAIPALEQYAPSDQGSIGQLFAFMGYIETFFAEHMCNGVPEAIVINSFAQEGPTRTRSNLYTEALADFDSAMAHATSGTVDSSVIYLAAIGRGRAFLDADSQASAASSVAAVPGSYQFAMTTDATYDPNFIAQQFASGSVSMSDAEGHNGLPFVTSGLRSDVRVRADSVNVAGQPFVYAFDPYSQVGASLQMATGVEAGLIEAEVALRSGNISLWAATLNALRQSANPPLPVLTPDSTTTASSTLRVDVMFRERAFWLYLSGHRLGDLRRLVRQYGRTSDTVFPTGVYDSALGLLYGNDVTFVPTGEDTNTNYVGCFDRQP